MKFIIKLMNQKGFNMIVGVILIAIVFLGLFLLLNYIHYKNIKKPSFLYYTNLLYWQNGDHTTHVYFYNPNSNQETEILKLSTTSNFSLRGKDDIRTSPDRTKIAYVLTEETEPGMGSSRMVKSDLYIANVDGTNPKLVYSSTEGRWIPFFYWSHDSLSIKFMTSLYAPPIYYQYNFQDNTTRVISDKEYNSGREDLGDNKVFELSKRLLSFKLPFLPKDKSTLSLERDNNNHSLKVLLTNIDSQDSRVVLKLNDNDGFLGPISSDGDYFLYRPGNDSSGNKIQRGIELYFMNGVLLAQAPFRPFAEFIGFTN